MHFSAKKPASHRSGSRRKYSSGNVLSCLRYDAVVLYAKQHVARPAFDDHRTCLHPIREITQRPRVRQHLRLEDREDAPVAARRPAEEAGVAVVVHAGADEMGEVVVDRIEQGRVGGDLRTKVEQRGVAAHEVDLALDRHPFAGVPADVPEQLASPKVDDLIDAGLQCVRAVPDAERAVGVAALGPMLEGKADRLIKDGLFEGAVDDWSRGPEGGRYGGKLQVDRGLPASGVGREVVVKVLRLAQGDDVAMGISVDVRHGEAVKQALHY